MWVTPKLLILLYIMSCCYECRKCQVDHHRRTFKQNLFIFTYAKSLLRQRKSVNIGLLFPYLNKITTLLHKMDTKFTRLKHTKQTHQEKRRYTSQYDVASLYLMTPMDFWQKIQLIFWCGSLLSDKNCRFQKTTQSIIFDLSSC